MRDGQGKDEIHRAKAAATREAGEETGLDISASEMVTWSCWIPPIKEKRRFLTWFFVVKAPEAPVFIDQGEIQDYKWVCPQEFLSQIPSPDTPIMPATLFRLGGLLNL